MNLLPSSLEKLIDALGNLPGVGSRTAERYAYFLVKHDPAKAQQLSSALEHLHAGIKVCPKTFALIDASDEVSPLYTHPKRDKTIVAVVAEPFDILALEKTALFKGTYHVLGGLVSPIDNVGPEQLHIKELVQRIEADSVTEIILATNASMEGESTALYIQQQLAGLDISITRLARGLPIGVDIEYADQITLGRALENRQTLL
ncbi:MAG: recombination protein RecR [Patescibacteria group bacterium]|nr:recombination protein RecR [Candidatus Saccharibacteria bacterium]MDQ5963633.1 recombination protein RecR [Patescibacteria group bacterium]